MKKNCNYVVILSVWQYYHLCQLCVNVKKSNPSNAMYVDMVDSGVCIFYTTLYAGRLHTGPLPPPGEMAHGSLSV